MTENHMTENQWVLFVDGHCVLCSSLTQWVLGVDTRQRIYVASLQSQYAKRVLPQSAIDSVSQVVFFHPHTRRLLMASDAVSHLLRIIGRSWMLLGWFMRIVPRPIREWGYYVVASRRYGWFGQSDHCLISSIKTLNSGRWKDRIITDDEH